MLLSFPLDPPPSVIEIISDSVYANSGTLDGRRFASEFVAKRKADAALAKSGDVKQVARSLADGKVIRLSKATLTHLSQS
jgi:PERQ amino acid-rich with GYF domain-containing protein